MKKKFDFFKKSDLKYSFKVKSIQKNFAWIKIYFLNQEIQNQLSKNKIFRGVDSLNLIGEKIIKNSLIGELNLLYWIN